MGSLSPDSPACLVILPTTWEDRAIKCAWKRTSCPWTLFHGENKTAHSPGGAWSLEGKFERCS